MKTKTRKFIWSAPLVAAFAIIGALTLAGVLLLPNADQAAAQDGGFDTAPTAGPTVTAATGNTEVTLTIEAASQDAAGRGQPTNTGYKIQHYRGSAAPTDEDDWIDSGTVTADSLGYARFVVTGLTNDSAYVFRAAATRGDDVGAYTADGSVGSATPAATTPGKVTGITLKQTGNVVTNDAGTDTDPADDYDEWAVLVSWMPPANDGGSDIIGYVVQVSGATASTFTDFVATPTADLAEDTAQFSVSTSESVMLRRGGVVRITAVNSATDGTDTTVDPADITGATGSQEASDPFSPVAAVSLSTLDFGGMVTDIDSTSANAGVNITVKVNNLTSNLPPGSSIVLYLEDDYVVPSSIPANAVHFSAAGSHSRAADGFSTGLVIPTIAPTVKTGAYLDANKKDYAIRVRVPNFCDDGASCGPEARQDLTMVVTSAAGIKNPSEAGTHSHYVDVLGPTDPLKDAGDIRAAIRDANGDVMEDAYTEMTLRKISLSSVDGTRGDELTVTGSGFKNGLSAGVFVLSGEAKPASCLALLDNDKSSRVGSGTVGSDDKVSVTFEITVPTFMPGSMNHICMADGKGGRSSDIDSFTLDPSIRVSPSTANVGDTVTVFAEDFEDGTAGTPITLASRPVGVNTSAIGPDRSGTETFVVPGWAEGTLRVEAWGKDTKLTVIGSALEISKSEALPNELLTIRGDGFSTSAPNMPNYVPVENITIDGVPLHVHEESQTTVNGMQVVDVSSSGQFVATVVLWPAEGSADNPALTAGVHTIKVVDNNDYSGTVVVTVPEPTISVTPGVAGPRDIVTISGENWPIDNLEGDAIDHVSITVDDGNRRRTYSVFPDSAGRFFVEHRVATNVAIPSTNRVTATYSNEVVEIATFEVPSAIIEVSPGEGQPGDVVSLSVDKMPVYASVDRVQIAGRDVLPAGNFSTDRTGSVTVDGVVIPGLDPGTYSILMDVDDTVAIGSLDILSEGPIGTEVPVAEALADLGDSLEAVFYFDNISKTWSFHDPRPEFADLNTLDNLVNGEAYWVLVSSDVADVVLNNKSRSLTCSGGDCWNLVIW